jgi:purine-binding chemotaxis protein CheW
MAEQHFITFYLGDDFFGINILLVRESNRNIDITPVALAPEYVRGLLNLRGQVVTVLDLGVRLNIGRRTITDASNIIILKNSHELSTMDGTDQLDDTTTPDLVGLLVDRIGDVVTVDDSEIEPPPAHAGRVEGHFLSGVIKLQNRLLVTLQLSEVLSEDTTQKQSGMLGAAQSGNTLVPAE